MKVLVAGLSKTGTKTMATALRLLGYKVYDWMENFHYLGDEWQRQIRDGFKMEDMRRMYENVDAVTDGPCDAYWEEIFDAFPDVKVILTTRDEKDWIESLKKHSVKMNKDFWFRVACILTYTGVMSQFHVAMTARHIQRYELWPFTRQDPLPDETLSRVKKRHESDVESVVPREQLLVYEVKDGWKPLCDFLSVPVPDIPFPHENKGGTLVEFWRKNDPVMQRIEIELKIALCCLFMFFAGVCSIAIFLFC